MAAIALLVLVIILMLGAIAGLILADRIQAKHTSIKVSEDIGQCALCQERRTGLKFNQAALTGFVFFANYRSFSNYACPQHARTIHDQFQRHTLLKGWWSLYGFVRAPMVLFENRGYFNQYNKALSRATSKQVRADALR